MQSGLKGSMPDGESSFITKQRIAFNFSRAASTYDKAATLQKRVAVKLMDLLPAGGSASAVLDLGAGTGCHSRELSRRNPDAIVAGMDLAMGMLQFARQESAGDPGLQWCSGDIEALPFRRNSFDLVYSSLAVQWCQLEQVFAEVERALKPGGQFVFSTLACGSLYELDAAWEAIAESRRVNQFDTVEIQHQCAQNSALLLRSFSRQAETLYYPDVISLLHELKALGVNTVLSGSSGLITRSKLQKLQQAYEAYRTSQGLPLTYQVIYGVLQKPGEC